MPALLLRRWRNAAENASRAEPTAAMTRWRIAPQPSAVPVPGLGRERWLVELLRCNGAEPRSWILEACDAKGRLALPSDVADRSLQEPGDGPPRDEPLVIATTIGARRLIVAADGAAQALGLRPGLTVAQAQALVPELHVVEADPAEDEGRFSARPLVQPLSARLSRSTRRTGCGSTSPASPICSADEAGLLHDLVARLRRQGIAARAAVADAPGAAWAVARFGDDAGRPAGPRRRGGGKPAGRGSSPRPARRDAAPLGVDRVGQLAAMPRAPMIRRFGADVACGSTRPSVMPSSRSTP